MFCNFYTDFHLFKTNSVNNKKNYTKRILKMLMHSDLLYKNIFIISTIYISALNTLLIIIKLILFFMAYIKKFDWAN